MKEEELKKWLFTLEPTEDSEEIVAWIMEALRMLHLTIDVDSIVQELGRQPRRREILYLVAYGTPDLPFEFRKKKPFILNDDDYYPFYRANDDEYKRCWDADYNNYGWKEFLIPIE